MKDRKKLILTTCASIMFIILVIGFSLAVFNYAGVGENVNQVTTGAITMIYTEGQDRISITNAMPLSDDQGKNLSNQSTEDNNVFDFTVEVNITGPQAVSYEVTAEKILEGINASTLTNNDVKLYLQKGTTSGSYSDEVLLPSNFTPLENADEFGAETNEMVLDSGTTSKSVKYYYRLKMWVDEDYNITNEVKKFTVKINVYGKDGVYDPNDAIDVNAPNTTYACLSDFCEDLDGDGLISVGDAIYLDPTKSASEMLCDAPESDVSNKQGCMRWYVTKSTALTTNLILEHNIGTSDVKWNTVKDENGYYNVTKNEIQTELNKLVSTNHWQLTPGLIKAEEIAEIIGKDDFDPTTAKTIYFGSLTSTSFSSQTYAQKNVQRSFHWLFDNLTNSTSYGGSVSASGMGYWTDTPVSSTNNKVWQVAYSGSLTTEEAKYGRRLRPTVTIPTSTQFSGVSSKGIIRVIDGTGTSYKSKIRIGGKEDFIFMNKIGTDKASYVALYNLGSNGLQSSSSPIGVAFANEKYWTCTGCSIFNEQSNLYSYINNYYDLLKNNWGAGIESVRLMNYSEADYFKNSDIAKSSSEYWIDQARSDKNIYVFTDTGTLTYTGYNLTKSSSTSSNPKDNYGIRPVIIVPLSELTQ